MKRKEYFNPRPRKEGDTASDSNIYGGLYFNPRPRKEGDFFFGYGNRRTFISIHALVKRATKTTCSKSQKVKISIHALVKRATYACWGCGSGLYDFNPRPRKEGDIRSIGNVIMDFPISIHALVKRATIAVINQAVSDYNFNPRPRKEGDQKVKKSKKTDYRFQSTPS